MTFRHPHDKFPFCLVGRYNIEKRDRKVNTGGALTLPPWQTQPRVGNQYMQAVEYKAALTALGISHEAVAETLGIGVRSSYRYASEGGCPKPVAIAIRLMLASRGKSGKRKKSALLAHAPVGVE